MKRLHIKPPEQKPGDPGRQKAGLLWYIIGMVIILTIYRILISVVALLGLFKNISDYQRHTQGLATFLLVLMMGLLWMAYRQWQSIIHERDQLETILASIGPDMILAVDSNNKILRCGGAIEQMSGYKPEELIGQKVGLLYHDRRSDGQGYEIQSALEQTGFYMGYTTGRTKSGEDYLLEMQTSRLRSLTGGAVVLLRNLDERQQARVQLQRRIRLEETFAAISTEFLKTEPEQFGEACTSALQQIAEIFDYESATAVFFDMQTGQPRDIQAWPKNEESTGSEFSKALAEAALASANSDNQIAYRFPEDSDRVSASLEKLHATWKIRSLVLSPMKLQNQPFGFLALFSKERSRRRWAPEDTTVLKALAATFMAGELSIHSRKLFQPGSE